MNEYKILLENSTGEKNRGPALNEEVNAEFYDVMVGEILKDRIKSFIGHHIGETQVFKQPTGVVFARKEDANTFQIVSKAIEVKTNKTLVQISQEAWEDVINLSKRYVDYKANIKPDEIEAIENIQTPELFINWVKSCSGYKETIALLTELKNAAVQETPLVFDGATGGDSKNNGETNLFYISKKVADCVIKMNTPNFRTYDAFCVLPQKGIGGILALSFTYSKVTDASDENRANDYFLGKINNVKYYLNPDPKETSAIVGLHSHMDKGVSSLIYSPYCINLSAALNADSGERTIAVFTRNAYTIHPLHTPTTPMLMKFEIQETN